MQQLEGEEAPGRAPPLDPLAGRSASAMGPLALPAARLGFPAQLEQAFRQEYYTGALPRTRLTIVLSLLINGAFGLFDLWIIPQSVTFAWTVRYGVITPVYVLALVATYLPFVKERIATIFAPVGSLVALVGGVGIAVIVASIRPGDTGRLFYDLGLMVVFLVSYTLSGLPFAWMSATNLLTLATYEIGVLILQRPLADPHDLIVFLNVNGFLVTTNLAGMFAAYFMELYARRDFLQRQQLARANEVIGRYVASQLAEQIRAGYAVAHSHERRKLTLFFSDIQDFATVADQVEPEDFSVVLNEYLSEMTAIGEKYDATIDKFVGDAIMIFFGAPTATDDRDHALRAVRMALEMQARMTWLRARWQERGFPFPFHIRIGINTGYASIGNFGSKSRLDYTAIGRQVNLAARLQALCEPDRVLIAHSTWALVHDELHCVAKGETTVKGFREPVVVYEVDDPPPARARAAAG